MKREEYLQTLVEQIRCKKARELIVLMMVNGRYFFYVPFLHAGVSFAPISETSKSLYGIKESVGNVDGSILLHRVSGPARFVSSR